MFNELTRGSKKAVFVKFTAVIAGLCLFVYGLKFGVTFFSEKPVTVETMAEQAVALNAKLPQKFGHGMQLTHVSLEKNALIFNLLASDSIALKIHADAMKENITKNICKGDYFKPFLQKGGTVEYDYTDHEGKLMKSISVDESDCK